MNWIIFLTRKYLRTRNKRGIRLVLRLAVIGVALSVGTLLVTQSVMSGFEKVFRESVLGFNAHLVVLSHEEKDFREEWENLLSQERFGEVLASTSFLYREGLLVARGKVKGAVLKGIDPLTFGRVYGVRIRPLSPSQVAANIRDLLKVPTGAPAIILGENLARDLGVTDPGETIKVFLPRKTAGALTHKENFRLFQVTGIFSSGLYEFDQGFAFVDKPTLEDLYGIPGGTSGLEIRLKDPDHVEDLEAELQRSLGLGYEVVSWKKLNGPLFRALRMERTLFFVIMAMVVMVAAFNIVGVLLLMIFEKTREISILRAVGTPYRGLKRLFGLQGLWIGGLGCLWGLILGGLVAWFLKKSQIFRLAKEVYLVGELPVDLSLGVVGTVVGVSLLISYFATQFAVARLNKTPLDL